MKLKNQLKAGAWLMLLATTMFINQRPAMAAQWQAPEDNDSTLTGDTIVPVAILNDTTKCPTLAYAIWFASDSTENTIKLVDDVKTALVIFTEGKTFTLNLNGHTIEPDSTAIYNYGTLTITDSISTGKILKTDGNMSVIYNYGTLTILGGSYECSAPAPGNNDLRRCIFSFANSTTTIKDGRFTSTGEVLSPYGDLTIEGGDFTSTGNSNVVANRSTRGLLTINGGTFTNAATTVSGKDERNCLWTTINSTTVINDATFTSPAQVIMNLGKMTIEGGVFTSNGNDAVITHYSNTGQLTINDGTFTNQGKNDGITEKRRVIYTSTSTKTYINGGTFTSPHEVAVFNGSADITDGEFTSKGNTNVIGYYSNTGEMVISGGTFTNEGEPLVQYNDTIDYRRALWANEGTTTSISGGTFTTNAKAQAATIFGKATISGGSFENTGHGSGIGAKGDVTITDCRVSAWNALLCWEGGKMEVSGGLYSTKIADALIAEGYECKTNLDPSTKEKYPFKVATEGGITGDVNGDGSVDVADIAGIITAMASGDGNDAADVNGDGSIDVADIANVITIMAGN